MNSDNFFMYKTLNNILNQSTSDMKDYFNTLMNNCLQVILKHNNSFSINTCTYFLYSNFCTVYSHTFHCPSILVSHVTTASELKMI